MPVEIRELIIRAVAPQESNDSERPADEGQESAQVPDTHAIVQSCVKEVLRILKQEKDR